MLPFPVSLAILPILAHNKLPSYSSRVPLLLVATLFRGSLVGQPEEGITQILGMTIGVEIGITTTTTTVIIGLVLGIISSVGLLRTMGEEEVIPSQVSVGMVMGR
jgi:hypothetical protein